MNIIKYTILFLYVYVFAKIRNVILSIFGGCHFVILTYHRVSDDIKDDITVGVNQFKRHVKIINSNYDTFNLTDVGLLRGRKTRKPIVAISFDDGYRDNYDAARFLADQGIMATFFITTSIVGSSNGFPHDLKNKLGVVPALSWDQIYTMSQWGHSFASHTASHLNLQDLNPESALHEVARGNEDIKRKLGPKASAELFAYPHGRKEDLPDSVRESLPTLGIKYCFSAYGGVNYSDFDQYDINRQGLNYAFTDLAFRAAIEGWRVRVPIRNSPRKES